MAYALRVVAEGVECGGCGLLIFPGPNVVISNMFISLRDDDTVLIQDNQGVYHECDYLKEFVIQEELTPVDLYRGL